MSVSPLTANESDEVVEDLEDLGVEDLETLKFEEEGEFVKILADPKLPKQEEVEKHFLSGHIPYRNWCEICVRCRGREMGHQLSEREREMSRSIAGITVFPETS